MALILTRAAIAFAGVLLVSACGHMPMPSDDLSNPTPDRFAYCRDHSCETVLYLQLDASEWATITAPLRTRARTAADERLELAHVVATYEQIVARKAGTQGDIGGTIRGAFGFGQLDCVDETVNTRTLLTMLSRENVLYWHRPGDIAYRLDFLSDGAPHFAATIIERPSGTVYVVDSWFGDSGQPADIVALAQWEAGWNPAP